MIDGGVKANNAKLVSSWGVDIAVVGSGLINKAGSIKDNLEEGNILAVSASIDSLQIIHRVLPPWQERTGSRRRSKI